MASSRYPPQIGMKSYKPVKSSDSSLAPVAEYYKGIKMRQLNPSSRTPQINPRRFVFKSSAGLGHEFTVVQVLDRGAASKVEDAHDDPAGQLGGLPIDVDICLPGAEPGHAATALVSKPAATTTCDLLHSLALSLDYAITTYANETGENAEFVAQRRRTLRILYLEKHVDSDDHWSLVVE